MSQSTGSEDDQSFPVQLVGGHQPQDLGDFVGATTVTVRSGDHEVSLVGTGVADERTVQFSEKELASADDDSSTWRITTAPPDRFVAEPSAPED